MEPLKGLGKDGLTGSHVQSHWPLTRLHQVTWLRMFWAGVWPSAPPPGGRRWGLVIQPFWKELCTPAPVAGVQM